MSLRAAAQVVNPGPPADSARTEQGDQPADMDKKVFANPSVLGMGPSKGIVLRYERAPGVGVTSVSDPALIGNGAGTVRRLNLNEIKAYAPLWNRPHLKFVLGFNYTRQQFNFTDPGSLSYPLYQLLEDRNLKNVGAQLLMLRPIDGRKYFLFRVKGELNGDYSQNADEGKYRLQPLRDYLRTSAEFFYGWKKSPRYSLGVGAQFGYTFGRRSIFPALIYNRTFSDQWGVEAIFPARIRVRYNLNEKTLFYGGYEVQGDSYRINVSLPPQSGTPAVGDNRVLELRVTSLTGRLRVEREVLPVLWVAAEAGWRYYRNFDAFTSSRSRVKLIDSKLRSAPAFAVEVFLTPPRRILKQ